ncbi:PAS domain-containing sensor histidine kinase [Reichenbachiella agarivorans]|uniref:histidine kinase n=1 Tax=Reichenbachiella agarivorans TaxID=2979464 RepID=A0ABY6CLN5_9BACT|nr:PAS domain-containing sensor histidine kinase [Reichenbachiella agarivorans]UXP31432.1 PAS domain-containing sensor histidine kinase [Reichenbachiella agarivorans]
MNNTEAYKEIFNSIIEGILVFKHGKVILVNPQCVKLFGYSMEEFVGMSVEDFVPSAKRTHHQHTRSQYMQHPISKQMGVGRDLEAVRKDGSLFPVEISLNPALIGGEEAIIVHVIDISVRKKAEIALKRSEEQLIEYAAELEKRVEERTRELEEVVNDLKQSNIHLEEEIIERIKAENEANKALSKERELNEMKSRFVSMASHEFRTPLSTILSSAALIARYTTSETQENRDKHINRIKANVSELTSILNEFLSLEKIDAGKMHVEKVRVEIGALVTELVSELSTITKEDQHILFTIPSDSCYLVTDPQILRQVLTNLLSNAIKYSDQGSEIHLLVQSDDYGLVFQIKDQGMGIPENDQKYLFGKFFRAHNSHHIQGTGLGLNIVQKYLELLDGKISFESVEGKGSTFTVKFNN